MDGQCGAIRAHKGEIQGGDLDGCPAIVAAWMPTAEERARIAEGAPVFVMFLGEAMPPHSLQTQFPL